MDLMSIVAGMIAGAAIGYIFASLRLSAEIDDLTNKHEALYREYSRLTDRDARGRFTKREK